MAGKANRTNGKGDQPRKVNGPKYRDNYDSINWNKPNEKQPAKSTKEKPPSSDL